ncbi:MAG: hypothetical protein E7Y34_02450, partial [Mycoplasma sp.]|nr:hypothetical protein [Mycoplasma sp.]
MKSILNVLKEVGDALNFECECDKKNKVERIVSEELKDYLDQDITIVDVIVSFLTFGTTLINKTNKLQQEKINNYVLRNHNKLAQFYNENTVNTFTQFLKEGFSNGFMGKLSSSFGGESIKDRAYFIYDKKINKHWNLNNVKIKSTAKFRKWFPVWETYTKYGNSYLNVGNNRLSYGAINASQGTWVGTYYGKIENIKNNYYTLHYNADWLEYINISFEPSYTKISKHIIKEKFIKDAKEGINRLLSIK